MPEVVDFDSFALLMWQLRHFISTLLMSIVLLLSSSCAKQNYINAGKVNRPVASIEDLDWDLEVGRPVYESFLHHSKDEGFAVDVAEDKRLVGRLNHIMKKLQSYSQIPNLPFQVHLVDSPEANAACFPGGEIVFFKGIFDLKEKGFIDPKSDDEITAVMSHEMSHAVLRHSYRSKKTSDKTFIAAILGSIAAGQLGGEAVQTIFQVAFDVSTGLFFPKYSRGHESEADLEGVIMMYKSGFEPEAAVKIWQRAMARGGYNATTTDIFAGHPSDKTRAQTLARVIALMRSMGIQE